MNDPIVQFKGTYSFLSNFAVSHVKMAGTPDTAVTVEHAFQATKMTSMSDYHRVLAQNSPGGAKRLARSLPRREDWEEIKTEVMEYYVREKFVHNEYLKRMLVATGDRYLIEGNNWGDRCWGQEFVSGQWVGENRLGLILMRVRATL